jgi:hypothetical protein
MDIHTFKRWCNHCKNAADFDTHHETCEFAGLKKEVKELRAQNFRMREILMTSYAPRAWEEE